MIRCAEPTRLDMLHDQVLNHRHMTGDDDAETGNGDYGDDAQPAYTPEPTSDEAAETDATARADDSATADTNGGRDDAHGEMPGAFRRPHRPGMPATKLYLHWDRESGTFTLEGVGAISRREALDILNHSTVRLTPVIDLMANPTYTGYVPPPKLKEHTALLNAGLCTFPSCTSQVRSSG